MNSTSQKPTGCLQPSLVLAGQVVLITFLACLFAIIDLFPTYGAPFFRYTGSHPDDHVWNLGFPIPWLIYDDHTSPHWFTSFPEVAFGVFAVQAVVLLACVVLPWRLRKK